MRGALALLLLACATAGADVVGANCGAGVKEMIAIARAFAACSKVPVAIQPNAGLPLHVRRA